MKAKSVRAVLLAGGLAVGLVGGLVVGGCEEKSAAPAAKAPETKSLTDSATDAVKDATDKTKEAVKDTAAKVEEKVKETAAAITDQAKKAMNDYLAGLGDANSAMEKVKTALDIPTATSALSDATGKISSNSAILGALPEGEKGALKDANKDQISSLTAKFKEQLDRLMKDPTLSKLADSVKSVKLFE